MIRLSPKSKVVVLTGAGISAESGIRTFRDTGGLWENHRIEDVATPQGFCRDPGLVWKFYRKRYLDSEKSLPNAGHYALVQLEKYLGDNFTLVTQNVDGLHGKAGSKRLIEMHGSLGSCFCTVCNQKQNMAELASDIGVPICNKCGSQMRPDIVWFGEIPYSLYEIEEAVRSCEYLIIVGTSGVVYPAAGFVMSAKLLGATTVAVNLEKPDNMGFIDEFYQGKSGEILPKLLVEWLGGKAS